MSDDAREEFLRLARRLVAAYSPCGVLEEELVRSIIEARWQLRRANLVDCQLLQIYAIYEGQNRGVGAAFAQDATRGNTRHWIVGSSFISGSMSRVVVGPPRPMLHSEFPPH